MYSMMVPTGLVMNQMQHFMANGQLMIMLNMNPNIALEITIPILFKKHIDNSNFELTKILKKISSRISYNINKHYIDEIYL